MSISMSTSAHYVTQSSIYSCPKLGRLTDRAIARYRKLGFYSTGFIEEHRERQNQKEKHKANKGKSRQQLAKETLSQLLEEFI